MSCESVVCTISFQAFLAKSSVQGCKENMSKKARHTILSFDEASRRSSDEIKSITSKTEVDKLLNLHPQGIHSTIKNVGHIEVLQFTVNPLPSRKVIYSFVCLFIYYPFHLFMCITGYFVIWLSIYLFACLFIIYFTCLRI